MSCPKTLDHQALNVLVADDSATVRAMIKEATRQISIPLNLCETNNGQDCLDALSSGIYQIAFLDIHMPHMSGLEAVAISRLGGDNTFVVFISSQADQERFKIARALKAYDYLTKPFGADDIVAVIEKYLRFSKPSSVLIVDDSATVRGIIKKVLNGSLFNLHMQEAENGFVALEMYQKVRYDIIFLDINMPGINGLEVLTSLKSMNTLVNPVLMTGDRSDELAKSVSAHGIEHFLYKPFFAKDVDRVLHSLFGLRMPELDKEPMEKVEI